MRRAFTLIAVLIAATVGGPGTFGQVVLPVPGTFARVELTVHNVVFLEDEERRVGPLSEPLAILTPEIPFVSLDTGTEGRFIERTGHVIVRPLGSLGSLLDVNAFIPVSQCTDLCGAGIITDATHRVDDYIFTASDPLGHACGDLGQSGDQRQALSVRDQPRQLRLRASDAVLSLALWPRVRGGRRAPGCSREPYQRHQAELHQREQVQHG